MVNLKSIVKKLQKNYSDAQKIAIVSNSGKVLYCSDNWNIKSDIKDVFNRWNSRTAQYVTINKIRYSILQMEPERLVATNRKKQGHLVAATSPDGKTYFFVHIRAKAKGWIHMAYPTIARAAAMVNGGSTSESFGPKIETSKKRVSKIPEVRASSMAVTSVAAVATLGGGSNAYSTVQTPYVEPYLKNEIEGFLEWVKTPQGLASYLSDSLRQNDRRKISELADVYQTLYRIFYP